MSASAEPPSAAADVLDTPAAGALAIRGSAVRALGYVLGTLLTLASAPLLVRHLGVVDFGRYFTVISLIALVGGVTDIGLATVALREYSVRAGAARDAFMREIAGLRLALTGMGVLGAVAFAAVAGYGAELVLGTALAGAGLLLTVVAHTLSIPLAAQLRNGWLTLVDVGTKALGVALIVALVLSSAGLASFLAITIPASVGAVVANFALTRGQMPLRPSLRWAPLRRLLRETLALAMATVLSTLYARAVILVMSLTATGLATGYFGTGARVMEAAVGMPLALIGTTFPIFARAARDDEARLRYVLQRVAEIALIGGVWMTLVIAVGAEAISDLLVGGPDAGPVAGVLRVLSLALTLIFLNVTWQTAMVALRLHAQLLVVNTIALVAIAALTLTLVPVLEAEGGALAVVLGELVLVTLSAAALLRARPALRPALWLVPRLTAATLAAVGTWLATGASSLAGMLVVSLAYFAVLVVLRALPPEVLTAFRQRLRPGSSTA